VTPVNEPVEPRGSDGGFRMTEEANNETTGQAMGGSEPDTVLDAVVPEDPAQAMDLPAAIPPPPAGTPLSQASAPPPQASTPPMGLPQETPASTPPTGLPQQPPAEVPPTASYAMGALAGNPAPGEAPSAPYGAAPGYGAAAGFAASPGDTGGWPAPPAPPTTASGTHKVRNGLLVGGAALAVLAAGIGIGHGAWNNGTSNLSASNVAGNGQLAPRSGSGASGNGSGGFPFGGRGFSGNSGNSSNSGHSGSSGNSGSGSSNSSGPSDVNAIASKVDPGLVDINTTLGYQDDEDAGPGI